MQITPTRTFDNALLTPYRQKGDAAADAVVEQLGAEGGRAALGEFMRFLGTAEHLSVDAQPAFVQAFFEIHNRLPSFADRERMAKGMDFFWRYNDRIALILGCYSLPYCYAAADGAQVLWFSQRIKNDTFKRLEETGEFVYGIMQERDWRNGRNGIRILKIRLMHAVIRYFTKHAEAWNSGWGLPINQEDMAGTNLAFSYIVIRGLRKLSVYTEDSREADFLHFWSVVGALLGVEERLLPLNLREAYHLDRTIFQRQFKTSEAGIGLTKALIKVLQQQAAPPALRDFPLAQMRFLLGNDVAELLNVPQVPLEEGIIKFASQVPFFQKLFRPPGASSPVLEKYGR
ncbi:oxygenase MpaB family protein [Runella slithyformis]|uniref:ER-bound oxygenase mpaB/mpaB'/Rubber oxygenase catalytic domain-containing protein n=1 Tax=Runella slithyformis (strain ATCC 29530 / DSM 19594 / LMG 11500 / NCIMB 11436 / LSU 4) TaxID=761193 RepID=A0A7U3ZGK5_RUNSL|nr:oxygenase MpaB family protein [Runella slithyformis]AEI46827.1 hypothetical protein Runsl_0375 [Runella slithyformis DSM 19594]